MESEFLNSPLFRNGDRALASALFEKRPARHCRFAQGDTIARQGSPCHALILLHRGSVHARMTNEEGRELILDTLTAPDVLASAFIFATQQLFPVSIIANTDCDVWTIDRATLHALLEGDAVILRNFLTILSDHSLFLSRRVHQFALQTLSSRLIDYLATNPPIRNLRKTAEILGVTRPSLSRAIARLVRQGVVRKSDAGYELA